MTIIRNAYPLVAALFLCLTASPPINAQEEEEDEEVGEVVCWWCWEVEGGHEFVIGGERCVGGIPGTDEEAMHCSRCGGTTECHPWQPGPCHRACGPTGDAVAALTEIQKALDGGDITVVASALNRRRTGVSIEFLPDGGRIDFILPCDPTTTFRTIPVPPEARAKLELRVRTESAATATQASLP